MNGLTIGLLAVGLVLVYKSNRFLNLAHAQLGSVAALLLAKWVLDWGWNWWVAFTLALVVGIGTGLLVDLVFVGPLRRRGGSTVRLLLLSLALSQVLLALTYVPALQPNPSRAQIYPQPFSSHLRIGHVALTGMSVLSAIVVPILVVALGLFMRYSTLGRQIRAAANNPDAARLCGISVDRVSAITWGMAGGLSAVSAVMQAPNQSSFDAAALGPYLLMLTLGAAAAGTFVSLPRALAGGIGLGIVSQVVTAQTRSASDGELAVFVAILLLVFVRGGAISRVFAVGGRVMEALAPARVPPELEPTGLVRYQRLWLGVVGVAVAVLLPGLPYLRSEGHRFLLVLVLLYALLAVALTMLVGWAGQVSLGHFAVVGLGAYIAARFAAHGWSLLSIMVVAGVVGAAVMLVVGLPALRVGGLTLSVTTIGLAVLGADWLFRQSWAGSRQTFVSVRPIPLGPDLGTPKSELGVYYVALAVLVVAAVAAGYLRRLGPGRLVIAVRDNEKAAASFGVVPGSVKLAVLALSGLLAGVGGVIWADAWHTVAPSQFQPELSLAIVALPVIGGLGSVGGAVVAAALLYGATFFLGPHVSGLFGSFGNNLGFQLFLSGMGQIGVLLAYPNGIAGAARQRWQTFLEGRARWITGWRQSDEPQVDRQPRDDRQADQALDRRARANGGHTQARVAPAPGVTRAALPGRAGWRSHSLETPLVTEGVRVHFGGVVALDGADVRVEEGEIVGLIGPNGAGKTTLMNVVSGVCRADTGSVRVFGQEVADLPADFRAALGVARSFQEATLFPGLTVIETLQVALAYRHKVGMAGAMIAAPWVRAREWRSRARAEQIAARFGLGDWSDVLTQDLSTGTRRICDLAAQYAAAPRLLLLDEPTAGVAQRDAEAFGPLLHGVREELGCAVLLIEHDMPLLMGLCDRVYAMAGGRVIADGTATEVRDDPRVIASYLGSEEVAISRSGTATPARRGRTATTPEASHARS